mgnify:CR=1 FL=1
MDNIRERFFRHVDKTERCWLWNGYTNAYGYGTFGISHRSTLAHRVSWNLHKGEIPSGICVLHFCDNPPCVNPDHLFLGTHKDNMHDATVKGRIGAMKVTAWDVANMRQERKLGVRYAVLADRYGLTQGGIRAAVLGITWKHVDTPSVNIVLQSHGSIHLKAKLTEEMVKQLRSDRASGMEYRPLGHKYGVSAVAARNAFIGKTWKHVE